MSFYCFTSSSAVICLTCGSLCLDGGEMVMKLSSWTVISAFWCPTLDPIKEVKSLSTMANSTEYFFCALGFGRSLWFQRAWPRIHSTFTRSCWSLRFRDRMRVSPGWYWLMLHNLFESSLFCHQLASQRKSLWHIWLRVYHFLGNL